MISVGVLAIEAWPPIDSLRKGLGISATSRDRISASSIVTPRGCNERFAKLATDLVSFKVDVTVTWGTDAALAGR